MDAEKVRELFDYDPEMGILRWRNNRSCHLAGSVAGSIRNDKRYIEVRYNGKFYMAHRLVFLWMTGRYPTNVVDHINRDGLDNRWCNLREATHTQNVANQKLRITNKLGLKGVIAKERYGIVKYEACIRVAGKRKHLGRFNTAQEAHQAYIRAAEEAHGEFAKGSIK
jgi:hypothetical protein